MEQPTSDQVTRFMYKSVACSFEKILMMRKTDGKRRREFQRMRRLDGIADSRT